MFKVNDVDVKGLKHFEILLRALGEDALTCPPRLPHSKREFASFVFIFVVVGLVKRVGRGAVK